MSSPSPPLDRATQTFALKQLAMLVLDLPNRCLSVAFFNEFPESKCMATTTEKSVTPGGVAGMHIGLCIICPPLSPRLPKHKKL